MDYSDVFVVRTFVVHPKYLRQGVGTVLMNFAIEQSIKSHMKAIRLDVYKENMPGMSVYDNAMGTVDLGLGQYGLDWFKLYEKML